MKSTGVLAADFSIVAVQESDLDFKTKVKLLPGLRAPVERGDKVGELIVYRENREFTRLDIVARQGTGLASWLRRVLISSFIFFQKVRQVMGWPVFRISYSTPGASSAADHFNRRGVSLGPLSLRPALAQ